MGNYVFTTKTFGRHRERRRPRTRTPTTTSAASIIPALVEMGEGPRLRPSPPTTCRGETERGPRLLAGTSDRSTPTTTRNMDLVSVHPIFNLYNREVAHLHVAPDDAAGQVSCSRAPTPAPGMALDSMVCAGQHHLGRDGALVGDLPRRAGAPPRPRSSTRCSCHDVVIGKGRHRPPTPSSTRNVHVPPGGEDRGSTRSSTRPVFTIVAQRDRGHREGGKGP